MLKAFSIQNYKNLHFEAELETGGFPDMTYTGGYIRNWAAEKNFCKKSEMMLCING